MPVCGDNKQPGQGLQIRLWKPRSRGTTSRKPSTIQETTTMGFGKWDGLNVASTAGKLSVTYGNEAQLVMALVRRMLETACDKVDGDDGKGKKSDESEGEKDGGEGKKGQGKKAEGKAEGEAGGNFIGWLSMCTIMIMFPHLNSL